MLRCPMCGKEEVRRAMGEDTVAVIFPCLFSATFEQGLSDEEMQRKLDKFKNSGKMEEWLNSPLQMPEYPDEDNHKDKWS